MTVNVVYILEHVTVHVVYLLEHVSVQVVYLLERVNITTRDLNYVCFGLTEYCV